MLQRASQLDIKRPLDERKQTRLLLGAILKSDEKFQEAEARDQGRASLPPNEHFDPKLLYVLGKVYVAWGRRDSPARRCRRSSASIRSRPSPRKPARRWFRSSRSNVD